MLKARAVRLWFAIGALALSSSACSCPELDERVEIPNSVWVVSTEGTSCGALDSGSLTVFATDIESKRRIDLLVLGADEQTHVEYLGGNHVQISLPNLTSIRLQAFSFGPYQVTYKYIPSDNPEARANYQRWVANPQDPIAKKWYEDNIEGRMHSGIPHAPEPGGQHAPN